MHNSHAHVTGTHIAHLSSRVRSGEIALSERARERLMWLEHFCTNGYSVTRTCRQFRIPRMTLYRVLNRFRSDNPQSLEDQSRRPHSSRPAATPVQLPVVQPEYRAPVSSVCAHPHCLVCTLRKFFTRWKRALVVSSVLVNVAFLASLLGTALLEGRSVQADVVHSGTIIENGTSSEEIPATPPPSLPLP